MAPRSSKKSDCNNREHIWGIFLKKKHLRQRSQTCRASPNMVFLSGKNACGNIVRRVRLPKIWFIAVRPNNRSFNSLLRSGRFSFLRSTPSENLFKQVSCKFHSEINVHFIGVLRIPLTSLRNSMVYLSDRLIIVRNPLICHEEFLHLFVAFVDFLEKYSESLTQNW